jgi:Undecaprenyl-phosphate galactose phosphotransferase WbaP
MTIDINQLHDVHAQPVVRLGSLGSSQPLRRENAIGNHLAQVLKRAFDIVAAIILLVLLLPLFAAVAALVATDGGPVFFRHKRIGHRGKCFGCLKFRTMVVGAEPLLKEYLSHHPEAAEEWARDQKLTFDPRVTTIGRALRQTSLDEFPQLFNVLKGEMSLVGPRPVTESELARYGSHLAHYKVVRPGITGLWQVSGRSDLSYEKRVALDVEYVENWHLLLDAQILLRTPRVVLNRVGAN